jgi:hypothetical protein
VHYAWVITFTGALVLLVAHGFGRIKGTAGTFMYAFALCGAVALVGAVCSLFLKGKLRS